VPDTSAADWDIWHDANNLAMMHAAVRAAPALFLPMFAQAGWISRYGVPDLSEGFAATESTPLGDAEPFELGESTLSDDVMEIAARGVSEGQEADCYAEYERALDLCTAVAGPMSGERGLALCRANAFDNYQQCRGY